MNRTVMSALVLAFSTTTAMADASFSINMDLDDAEVTTTTYECGSHAPVRVHYVTSETDSLALVPVDGDDRVFVNVVAASGARYVAGQYEWWTKGETAMLTDLIADEVLLECKSGS